MSTRGAWKHASSSRPLPPLILLVLAAAAVAVGLGPALGARSVSALSVTFASASSDASGLAPSEAFGFVAVAAPRGAPAGISGDDRDARTPPPPSRVDPRHVSAAVGLLERPTITAVLPGIVAAAALLALLGALPRGVWRSGVTLPRGSARSPPASVA